jgi:sialic acid synthase
MDLESQHFKNLERNLVDIQQNNIVSENHDQRRTFKRPLVVAEHCCNHMGDVDLAKKMIDAAVLAGADYAKFQKWNARAALSPSQYEAPHPNPHHSFGEPYGRHREALEFSAEQHNELRDYCNLRGIKYSCSVFDDVSAKELVTLNPEYIKIPSQKNLRKSIYLRLAELNYQGDLHVSTGMTSRKQLASLVELLERLGFGGRVVLYSATSSYPCQFEDVHLLNIEALKQNFGHWPKGYGFSGHHNGIALDIAAAMLGVEFIERHFTLDRTMKGTDHAASLEPQGLTKLVRDLCNVEKALTHRTEGILACELEAFKKVKEDDWRTFGAE